MKMNLKSTLKRIWLLCPIRHSLLMLSCLVVTIHLLTRENQVLYQFLSDCVIRPLHRRMALLCSRVPFSVAELLIALAILGLLFYMLFTLIGMIRRPKRRQRIYRFIVTLSASGLAIYAGFCMLWGVYYYGDDFLAVSGLRTDPVSTEQLQKVTAYFVELVNEYGEQVKRNGQGLDDTDRDVILVHSRELYEKVEERFPCLEGPDVPAKGILCSRIMSLTDFTGFFFPFTAEANVNMDFPQALLASTVAHELAHQRGVAQEQEANFVAVLASLEDGDKEYCYSACLLAYIHLGNALYKADKTAWSELYDQLSEGVRADLTESNRYWAQFSSPVQTVSNTVYEGFLQSYDQELGLQSYGACVDLLVNYYYDLAKELI